MANNTTDSSVHGPAEAAGLEGTVVVTARGSVRIHSYISPADSFLVATHIVEGPSKLIVFDGQAVRPYAEAVATYIGRLRKPVDRIILSHGHPDHWSGLEVLTARLPSVPIYALAHVTSFVAAVGASMLGNLQRAFGDRAARNVTRPTAVLEPGKQFIDGIPFEFTEVVDGEANFQLLASMPQQRVMLVFDLVFGPADHMFTVQPTFDQWIATLERLKGIGGYDLVMVGHGVPTDRSALDANIAYLERARAIHAEAKDGSAYAAQLKAAFPDRAQPGWADFSGMVLYARH